MPKAKTPAINFKMYRHFAVVTVAVTFLLVIFAEGENGGAQVAGHAIAFEDQTNSADGTGSSQQEDGPFEPRSETEAKWATPSENYGEPTAPTGGNPVPPVANKPPILLGASATPTAEQKEAWTAVERKSLQRSGRSGKSTDR